MADKDPGEAVIADKEITPTNPAEIPKATAGDPATADRRTQGIKVKFRKLGRKTMGFTRR